MHRSSYGIGHGRYGCARPASTHGRWPVARGRWPGHGSGLSAAMVRLRRAAHRAGLVLHRAYKDRAGAPPAEV